MLALLHDAADLGCHPPPAPGPSDAESEVHISSAPSCFNLLLAPGVRMLRLWMLKYGRHSEDNMRNSGFWSFTISMALSLQCFRLKYHMYLSLAGTVKSSYTPPLMPNFRAILTTRGGL